MTTFLNGPAKGVTLFLKRAPVFLRVVQGPDGPTHPGDWDALDQREDTPRAGERITVYELVGEPTWMHVCRSGNRGGVYRGGTYKVVDPQPEDAQVRSTAAWRAWVAVAAAASHHDAVMPED